MSAPKTRKRPTGSRPSARVLANRRNALKSTGPKSIEGKARSASNALAHGLSARDFGPDHEKVERLALRLIGSSDDPEKIGLARIAAAAELRLRFVRTLKHAVWVRIEERGTEPVFDPSLLGDPLLEDLLDPEARRLILDDQPLTRDDLRMIARIRSFAAKLSRKNDPLSELRKLQRYERMAASQRDGALAELADVRGSDHPEKPRAFARRA